MSQMLKEVECPICRDTLKKPIRMLICGHNLCQDCLEGLIASSQSRRCPTCRSEFGSRDSVESFPRNHAVENIMEGLNQLPSAPIVEVDQEANVLTADAVKQLEDLAKSYEGSEQFKRATNVWQFIIDHSLHGNRIMPTMSVIICFLELHELDRAAASSTELIILLEAISHQDQLILRDYDLKICNFVEKFFECKQFDTMFQLLQLRFHLLKQNSNGEEMLVKISHISMLIRKVAQEMQNGLQKDLFKNHYCFFDSILSFMQSLPESRLTTRSKCENVAWFLNNYGFCCIAVDDYLKAIALFHQTIALITTVLGEEFYLHQDFANCHHNLGWALECTFHYRQAVAAYQTSLEIERQVRDYKSEEERNRSISLTKDLLLHAEQKITNL